MLDGGAAGQRLDPADDLGPVEEKLVADDSVAGVDLEPSALVDPDGMRVGRVRGPDDLRPLLANRLLRRRDPDPMLRPERVDELHKLPGRPAAAAGGVLRRDAA